MVTAAGTSSGWVTGPVQISVPFSSESISFSFALRAPTNAIENGAVVSTSVTAFTCQGVNCRTNRGSSTLSGSIAPLGASDMSLTCSPQSPVAIARNGNSTITCRVNALQGLGSTSLIVRSVTITAPPAGWTVSTSPAGTTGAGGSRTLSPSQTLAAGASWSFSITLSPSCTAVAATSWNISSQVANTNGQQTGPNVAGPSIAYSTTATNSSATTTLSLVSGPLDWDFTYSFDEQTAARTMTYRIVANVCSAWSVNISGQPFTYSGPVDDFAIPANNLILATVGTPARVAGSGGSVAAVPSSGGLGTPKQIATAQAGSIGTYEQTLGVSLTLPAGAPVGAYQSTITIAAVAAP